MPEAGANLLDIPQCVLQRHHAFATEFLEIAASEILENKVMKDRSLQVAGRAVTEAADDIRMSHTIKCEGLILKVLDKRPLQVVVEVILQKNVQRLNYYAGVGRVRGRERIAGKEDLGITAAPQFPLDIVPPVKPAIVQ